MPVIFLRCNYNVLYIIVFRAFLNITFFWTVAYVARKLLWWLLQGDLLWRDDLFRHGRPLDVGRYTSI